MKRLLIFLGLLFVYGSTAQAQTCTGGVDLRIYWSTTATSGSGKWTAQFVCTAVNAAITDDPPYPSSGAGFNTVTTAAPGAANRIQTSAITGITLPASCVTQTPLMIHIRLFSDGGDAADNLNGNDKSFVWAELTYRRM